ncbi:poly(3-hydroxybutyrate) depolymerase-like [Lampetra fluviatilis]
MFPLALFVALALGGTDAQSRLGTYKVDLAAVSVSGLSSGGCMATQFHVAHSKSIMGVAVIAGAPYYCAQNSALTATETCMKRPESVAVSYLQQVTRNAQNILSIDHTSHMSSARVFLFAGTKDSTVHPGIISKVQEYYQEFVTAAGSIRTVLDIPAEHGFPTVSTGGACGSQNSDYINSCGYHAAFELLNHIYGGGLQRPSDSHQPEGELINFDQKEYFNFSPPSTYGMDNSGYAYVPRACAAGDVCKLHIAFHGCKQGKEKLGDKYARLLGYNEVGDLNNIIILYPQARSTLSNPLGCWDWWGYTGTAYASGSGFQVTGVKRMMDRVTG